MEDPPRRGEVEFFAVFLIQKVLQAGAQQTRKPLFLNHRILEKEIDRYEVVEGDLPTFQDLMTAFVTWKVHTCRFNGMLPLFNARNFKKRFRGMASIFRTRLSKSF